jgi:Uma2 family endonuclease
MTSPGKVERMRAVVLDVPVHWLEERRRQGSDRWDEVWDGVLHMVPPPTVPHQMFAGDLEHVIRPLAQARGWHVLHETGLFGVPDESNYRVPDLVVVHAQHLSERGVERVAEIAIEIRSKYDESYEKLPFYAACGIREAWILDPVLRTPDVRWLDDDLSIVRTESRVLGLSFSVVAGPRLQITWDGGSAEI